MNFLSVCSGIEAASVAWNPLGWEAVAFAEIEPFPCAVLTYHYPTVPNRGDMTKYEEWPDVAVDLLCGGTPCQSFSVAGLRKGLDDPRGNLMLTFGAIAARYRPRWLVWENVPGVLSSNGGRDFGAFLGMLGQLGYGFAYRVLDAQYFGLAQRRKRVFVVGCLGDWRCAAAVLLERHCMQGNPAPRREKGQRIAATVDASLGRLQGCSGQDANHGHSHLIPLDMRQASRGATMTNHRAEGSSGGAPGTGIGEDGDPSPTISTSHTPAIAYVATDYESGAFEQVGVSAPLTTSADRTRAAPIVTAFQTRGSNLHINEMSGTLGTNAGNPPGGAPMVAWSIMPQNSSRDYKAREVEVAQPLMAGGPVGGNQGGDFIQSAMQVRRLTPRECERLQGFRDDYTLIPYRGKPAADGPRYKALGNSWAVPNVRWIGERIAQVESIGVERKAA